MKLKTVLLRWYKSFHMDYRGSVDRGEFRGYRPWNKLSPSYLSNEEFPFVAIPIDSDITTIVGANESGKSHLLNAIAKVIRGTGTDLNDAFKRTDLCHYAGVRTKNAEAWPNLGLEFATSDREDLGRLAEVLGTPPPTADISPKCFAVILAPEPDSETVAYVFLEPDETPRPLKKAQLENLRACLPAVQFIDSRAQLTSDLPLTELLAAYGDSSFTHSLPDRRAIQHAADLLAGLPNLSGQALTPEIAKKVEEAKQALKLRPIQGSTTTLEFLLFKEILGINLDTLKHVYELTGEDRGYIEGQIATWNNGLTEQLNLSHFWRQDEQFSLTINCKDGVIYFEIRDKTGSVYTFKERSSGLRYFLSYYIQAKAMEMTRRNRRSIILMDEPDAALSIAGQRNLLAVFESLVSPESSGRSCQLIYTTHSPYLINRNFPRRVRVVKKEDAEEGTQYIEHARARRYEPVRTALGVDSAPSLFLGTDNILLEGATDQYLISELIRVFATPDNVGNFLDLNMVVTVSADGVNNIPSVLEQSRWADEPIPPTVVIVDGDAQAQAVVDHVLGRVQGAKPLMEEPFVKTISDLVTSFDLNKAIITTEDIIPRVIYANAIAKYMERWFPKTWQEKSQEIKTDLEPSNFTPEQGLVESAKAFFLKYQPSGGGDFDKMTVLQEVIAIVDAQDQTNEQKRQLEKQVKAICEFVRSGLIKSRAATLKHSAVHAIKRNIKDFERLHRANASIPAMQQLFERLQRELAPIGTDGDECIRTLSSFLSELEDLRTAGQDRIVEPEWVKWKRRLDSLKKNPLAVTGLLADGGQSASSSAAAPA